MRQRASRAIESFFRHTSSAPKSAARLKAGKARMMASPVSSRMDMQALTTPGATAPVALIFFKSIPQNEPSNSSRHPGIA
jgi:hypothetical protein